MNLGKAIGIGALGLLAVSGWTLWKNLLHKKQPSHEQVLQALESARLEFYPVFLNIADFVSRKLVSKGLTPEQNEKLVLQDPQIQSQIAEANKRVYTHFTEEEIEEASTKLYAANGDIKLQRAEFKEEYYKSLMGVVPQRQITISRKLPEHKVLGSIRAILQDKLDRLRTQVDEQTTKEDIRSFLELDVEEDLRMTKETIRRELGLLARDSISIFHFAVMQYRKQAGFDSEYAKIVEWYNSQVKIMISQ